MNKTIVKDLLDKYLTGTLGADEKARLSELIEEPDYREQLELLMEESFSEDRFEDEEDAKIKFAIQSYLDKKINKKPAKIFRLSRMVAAASVILIISAGIWFANKSNDQKVATTEKQNIQNDVKAPASNKAMITLANGKQIILDSAGNGILATEQNVNITRLDDGQIVYSGTGNEVLYNTLTNPRGSKVINLTLADGSKVWLNAESSLKYPTAFIGTERKVEITGEAYFEVAHNAAMPFKVKKDATEITVLGTHFNVNAYSDEANIKVTLLEGSVKINKGPNNIIIKPGQQAQVASGVKVSAVDTDEVMAWKNGKFSYSNANLETIMRQMARWYDVEVEYKNKITDHYTVNISRDVPVSRLFRFIEMSGGVHFKIEGRKVIVTK